MEFTSFHREYFGARVGSFSRVTDRENYDSQITLTDNEADLVIEHFGENNIHIGNVKSDPEKSSKRFLLYPSLEQINLNLVFPKPSKPELRLYLRGDYKPEGGQIWFLYIDYQDRLVIGSLPENIWYDIGQGDSIDVNYQDEIEEVLLLTPTLIAPPPGRIARREIAGKTVYVRDPRLAVVRFNFVNYRCEVDETHDTFIAEKTKKPYVEAHHFVPMKFQSEFGFPLDTIDNITCLCPNCHRAIHHAVVEHKIELFSRLFARRPAINNFSIDEIAGFYNCIKV